MIKSYVLKFRFMQAFCPYKYHWCNGKHIPNISLQTGIDKSGFADLSPCKHYKNGHCNHPSKKVK